MAINFALERKRFREEQERLRRKYEALGMTKEQIREMYEFDLYQFNRDIAYSRHTQQLMPDTELEAEGKNPLLHKFEDELTVTQEPDKTRQLWWLDEIEDEALLESLLQLSEEDLLLIDRVAFREQTQTEISIELKVTQPSVSQRIRTIRKKLKKTE